MNEKGDSAEALAGRLERLERLTGDLRDAGAPKIHGARDILPIPASSGQTIRYRLDRSGDRKLNRALHMILVTRKRAHPARSPTSNDACKKAKPDAKQTAASSVGD